MNKALKRAAKGQVRSALYREWRAATIAQRPADVVPPSADWGVSVKDVAYDADDSVAA